MKKQKRHLFMDFDGLKYNTFPFFTKYYNDKYGINIKEEEFYYEKDAYVLVNKHIEISERDLYGSCGMEFLNSIDWHKEVAPYEGMVEVVLSLKSEYTIHTVTARQVSGINTIEYLNSKFVPGAINNIHCVWKKLPNNEYEHISKIDYILSHVSNAVDGIFLDDTPKEILRAQEHVRSILFDPCNVFSEMKDIKERATSWKMMGEMIRQMK